MRERECTRAITWWEGGEREHALCGEDISSLFWLPFDINSAIKRRKWCPWNSCGKEQVFVGSVYVTLTHGSWCSSWHSIAHFVEAVQDLAQPVPWAEERGLFFAACTSFTCSSVVVGIRALLPKWHPAVKHSDQIASLALNASSLWQGKLVEMIASISAV